MPTNLYGPGDNYHPENSHVIPALLRRFHEAVRHQAPEVVIWGSGTPRKLLGVSKLKSLGWEPVIPLEQGLTDDYAWFLNNQAGFR
ncbi:MAG: NAD-dependent epimerase/dehydratase family protein, partial [Desulfotignum sp.]